MKIPCLCFRFAFGLLRTLLYVCSCYPYALPARSISGLVAPEPLRYLVVGDSFFIFIIPQDESFCQAFFAQKRYLFSSFLKFFWLFFKCVLYFWIRKECAKWKKKGFGEVSYFRHRFTKKRKSKRTRNLDRFPAWWLSPWKNIWKKKRGGKNRIGRQLFICVYIVMYYIYTNMRIL